jgi:thymidylate kinase
MDNLDVSKIKRPYAIIIRGMPGSGKTYLAMALKKALGEDTVVLLDPDATDYDSPEYKAHVAAQIAEGVDPKLHAYRFLRAQAYIAIEDHKIFIWNQAFTNLEIFNKMVARFHEHAAEFKVELPILVVEIEIDPENAKTRIRNRQRTKAYGGADAELLKRIDDYQHITFAGEGFETVVVHGESNVEKSVKSIMEALK